MQPEGDATADGVVVVALLQPCVEGFEQRDAGQVVAAADELHGAGKDHGHALFRGARLQREELPIATKHTRTR